MNREILFKAKRIDNGGMGGRVLCIYYESANRRW